VAQRLISAGLTPPRMTWRGGAQAAVGPDAGSTCTGCVGIRQQLNPSLRRD
jgi:hypothetical protein